MKLNIENNNDKNKEKNDIEDAGSNPAMILTINIGNNQLRQLNIYDIDNTEQDIYNFCLKNKLDFNILKEIKNQIQILITNKLLENMKQNITNTSTKDISEINNINNNINKSGNVTEVNFIKNKQNNIDDLNNLEIFGNNGKKRLMNQNEKNVNSNLKK
jgi:hypothetical protein